MPRRPRGGLAVWLKETTTPLYVIDARRVVLFFNRGCEELTGWSAADVVGRTCEYASNPDAAEVDALLCALCPPPEALAGNGVCVRVEVPMRTGGVRSLTAVFAPLPGEQAGELRLLGLWRPLDEFPAAVAASPPSELHAELARLRSELHSRYQIGHVIAGSPAMRRVLAQVHVAAQAGLGVHFVGPAGSGREFLARVVHAQSSRRLRPFVPVDCASTPAFELKRLLHRALEPESRSEPHAEDQRPGALLLREVSRLPRDLQEFVLDRLTAESTVAESNTAVHSLDAAPLEAAVADERLLPEFACRLTPLRIEVPALRERMDDLPLLAQSFVEQLNRDGDRVVGGVAAEALDRLREYNWPGHVRELRAVIDEAYAATEGPQITAAELPFRFRTGLDAQRTSPPREPRTLDLEAHLRDIETREIRRALAECRENRAKAARLLGLTRTKLYRRMEQLGIAAAAEEPQDDGA